MLALKLSTAPHLSKGAARSGEKATAVEKPSRSDPHLARLAALRQPPKVPVDESRSICAEARAVSRPTFYDAKSGLLIVAKVYHDRPSLQK